ncbi:MAG: sensor histidine kinase, partial [Acidobacteriota bacterium]
RGRLDWFRHPARKIALLVVANIFFTAPLSVSMLYGWYRANGFAADWSAIRSASLMCIVCVLFITHVYETVYLIQQRGSDLVQFEKLERAKAEAELEALKAQVDPHFLFNSLNTLAWLIQNDAPGASRFNENLAEVYRYILHNKSRELVMVEEELAFLIRYFELLRLRFGDAVELEMPAGYLGDRHLTPPISLQILLENAVKHNEFSGDRPLRIRLSAEEQGLTMSNELRPRISARGSSRTGLRNLDERCRLTIGRGIEFHERSGQFAVTVPVEKLA